MSGVERMHLAHSRHACHAGEVEQDAQRCREFFPSSEEETVFPRAPKLLLPRLCRLARRDSQCYRCKRHMKFKLSLDWLLIFVPVAILLRFVPALSHPTALFICSAIAIIPVA